MPTIEQLLTEARAALHALMIGQAVVEVRDQTGESVRYSLANRGALRAYIAELEEKLANNGQRRAGPLLPTFGFR